MSKHEKMHLRQKLHPSHRTIAALALFSEHALRENPQFYTNAEGIMDPRDMSDVARIVEAEEVANRLANAVFTLVLPVAVSKHNSRAGARLRLHFAVAETERLKELEDSFKDLARSKTTGTRVPGSVYTDIDASGLAVDLKQLSTARDEVKRQVRSPLDGRSRLQVSKLHIVRTPMHGSLDIAA